MSLMTPACWLFGNLQPGHRKSCRRQVMMAPLPSSATETQRASWLLFWCALQ